MWMKDLDDLGEALSTTGREVTPKPFKLGQTPKSLVLFQLLHEGWNQYNSKLVRVLN